MTKVSILIPTYSAKGLSHLLIDMAFRSIRGQNFTDYETVVSDQSEDDSIELVCEKWSKQINIKYYRNPNTNGGPAQNANCCIKMATGEILKFLDSDDFFFMPTSLSAIVNAFTPDVNWLATKYWCTENRVELKDEYTPFMNRWLYVKNTIGSPIGVAVRNMGKDNILMDETLHTLFDCEYYQRFFMKFGNPKILNESTTVHYLWGGQIENSFKLEQVNKEREYVLGIYEP